MHAAHRLTEPDQVTRGLVEKFLIHATGHGFEFTDGTVISDIVRKAKAKNHGFRTLVHEVVASSTVQTK